MYECLNCGGKVEEWEIIIEEHLYYVDGVPIFEDTEYCPICGCEFDFYIPEDENEGL